MDLADASCASQVAEVAACSIAVALAVPCSVVRLTGHSGTPGSAAIFGDHALARHLPRDSAVGPFPRVGVRPSYLAVRLGSPDQDLGTVAVLRPRTPFTRSTLHLLNGLADIVATRLQLLQALELEGGSERVLAAEQLRTTYEAIACGVTVWAPDGSLLQYNHVAETLMGMPLESRLGKPLIETVRVVRDDGTEAPIQERRVLTAARTGEAIRDYFSSVTRPSDGQQRFLQMNAVPVFDGNGHVDRVVCSFFDITERKEAEDLLAHQAQHDSLTGLPNRMLLVESLQRAVEHAHRTCGSVVLLLLDLNGFKQINDSRGHHVGDALLRAVGERWNKTLRARDMLARQGGDEFSVMLDECNQQAARAVDRKLRRALKAPFILDGFRVLVGVSIGYAVFPEDGTTADQLLQQADVAMYRDKRKTYGANTAA